MKKLLVISLLAIVGCTEQQSNMERQKTTYILRSSEPPVEIVVVDSCEYLYGPWGNATVLTHKGNCKHCKKD